MAYRYVSSDPQSANTPARYSAADAGDKIRYNAPDAFMFKPRWVATDIKVNRYSPTDVDDTT